MTMRPSSAVVAHLEAGAVPVRESWMSVLLTVPETSNFAFGFVIPIPTSPLSEIVTAVTNGPID